LLAAGQTIAVSPPEPPHNPIALAPPAPSQPFTAFGIAGGSAGGAAAAVAARLTPFAVTIDSGLGDARVPAALCGVVGFRPTHGRYSREGLLSTSHTLDSAGFIARTVHDVQLLDAVVCAAMRTAEAPPAPAGGESKQGESKEADDAAAAAAAADPQAAAALKMQSMSRGFLARKRVEKVAKGEMDTKAAVAKPLSQAELDKERAAAAARIQAVARGKADRAQVGRIAIEKESAEVRLAALTKSDDAAAQAAGGDAKAARAAADAALAAEGARIAASGHDVYEEAAHAANDGVSGAAGPPAADWSGKAAFVKDLAGVRIGVPRRRFYEGLDAGLAGVVEEALRRLAKAGAVLVECDFAPGTTRDNDRHPIDLAADVIGPVAAFEVPRELAAYLYTHVAAPEEKKKPAEGEEPAEEEEESEEAKAARLAAGPPPPRPLDSVLSVTAVLQGFEGSAAERAALTAQLSRGTAGTSTTYRSALVYRRPALKRVFATLLKAHKLACIVYPTTPLPAAAMLGEERNLVELNGELVDATAAYSRNTSAASAAGLPALSIPCGMTRPRVGAPKGSPGAERLPVSLEFVADANDDERLLSLGRAIQRLQSAMTDPLLLRKWSNGVTAPHQ
jgi:Asp-tRNA(Asn)/Glu-tRNA(Gln) amidotransferase A subunit family amidase